MSRIAGIRRWLHLDRGVAEEIDAELAFHFDRTIEELVARGWSRDAAEEEGRRRFGDVTVYRETLREIAEARREGRRWRLRLEDLHRMLAQAWRGIWRRPSFTLLIALTLGLGIGVNAAMFGVLDRLMLRPPAGIRDPDTVRRMYVERSFLGQLRLSSTVSYSDIRDLEQSPAFARVAAVRPARLAYGDGPASRDVRVELVTPNYFPLLGVDPALGRLFVSADDSTDPGASVVVLSHGFWRSEFGGDPGVLGRTLALGDGHFRVIGVTAPGFAGPSPERVDAWLPLRPAARMMVGGPWETSRGIHWLEGLVRLAPGTQVTRAAEMATALHRAAHADDPRYDRNARVLIGPLLEARGPDSPPEAHVSLWIAGVSLAVLVVACANVANLLLLRAIRRRREVAVRLALGIGRGRLLGELLVEAILLALVAGAAGVVFALWGGEAIRQLLFPSLAWDGSGPLSWRLVGFSIAISLLAGLLAGVIPAWLESRPELLEALKSGTRQSGSRRSVLRGALVVTQAALSAALLVGAGLFLLSFHRVKSLDLGMDPSKVLLIAPTFPRETKPARRREVFALAAERIARLPGVERVGYSSAVPFRSNWAEELSVPGLDSLPTVATGGPYIDGVSADYFAALAVPMLQGRGFSPEDREGTARVAVVGETMASLLWPGQRALGKCLRIGGDTMPCTEVVGVARDVQRNSLTSGSRMQYYVPLTQYPGGAAPDAFFVRTSGDPVGLIGPARAALLEAGPDIRWIELTPMQALLDPEFRSWRMGATLFTAFGGLALIVAAIGLYSLLSYGVANRTPELGLRSALGARPSRLVALVARDGLALVGMGVALGVLVAFAGSPRLQPLLFRTSAREAAVYAGVGVVLLVIAALAGALPAWRATRVSPLTALRAE
ncbi:MAG TPA: ABC transporter permease [Gemmatimonadales bacterium]|nr:ABC transporter permease [Gemmatimonadales bacterium]